MTISTLKNGDLLFMRDSSDFSKAITKTTAHFTAPQYIAEILPIFDIIPVKFGDGEKEVPGITGSADDAAALFAKGELKGNFEAKCQHHGEHP